MTDDKLSEKQQNKIMSTGITQASKYNKLEQWHLTKVSNAANCCKFNGGSKFIFLPVLCNASHKKFL